MESTREAFKLEQLIDYKSIPAVDDMTFDVYVGCEKGHLCIFRIIQSVPPTSSESAKYTSKEPVIFSISSKKPVSHVCVMTAVNSYMTICDGVPQTWSMETNRETFLGLKYKNVSAFAYNMKDSPTPRLCLVIKKKLVLLDYTRNLFQQTQEHNIADTITSPNQIVWSGNTLFYINKHNYWMINTMTQSKPQMIDAYLDSKQPLCVKTISEDETIFSISSNTCVYMNNDGFPAPKNTIVFNKDYPLQMSYCNPYIFSLCSTSVVLHSAVDQTLVQTFTVPPECILNDGIMTYNDIKNSNRKYILLSAPGGGIMIFQPLPVDAQIEMLLRRGNISEAYELLQLVLTPADAPTKLPQFHLNAGLSLFYSVNIKEAFNHFTQSHIDPKEILFYYPNLYNKLYDYNPIHIKKDLVPGKTNDIVTMARTKCAQRTSQSIDAYPANHPKIKEILNDSYEGFYSMIEQNREKYIKIVDLAPIIDLVYVKVTHMIYPKQLYSLLSKKLYCPQDEVIEYLLDNQCYNELGHYYCTIDKSEDALNIWKKLGTGEYIQKDYNGINDTINYLKNCKNTKLIIDYSPWVLEKNPNETLSIYTNPDIPLSDSYINTILSIINNILNQFIRDDILYKYLEFLLVKQRYSDEVLSNELGDIYIKQLSEAAKKSNIELYNNNLTPGKESGEVGTIRNKLINFIHVCNCYNSNHLIEQLKNHKLYYEIGLIHYKHHEHKIALEYDIKELHDFKLAETYCISDINDSEPFNIFLSLLYENNTPENKEEVINIINKYFTIIDPIYLLSTLPEYYETNDILNYLIKIIPHHIHQLRTGKIVLQLERMEYLRYSLLLNSKKRSSFLIDENTKCSICGKSIGRDVIFSRQPNGKISHYSCTKTN